MDHSYTVKLWFSKASGDHVTLEKVGCAYPGDVWFVVHYVDGSSRGFKASDIHSYMITRVSA